MTTEATLVESALANARRAQVLWAAEGLASRLRVIRRVRHRIAEHGLPLAEASAHGRGRPPAEALTAEVLPLAAACRFLEREAPRLLAPRRLHPWTRPVWLTGVGAEVRRDPFGVVLIIGPGNYPLLLPGVQLVQALAAGNGVLLKPAPGAAAPVRKLVELLIQSGLDAALVTVLPDSVEAARCALAAGVDKVVFTGSAATGEMILAQLAPRLIPVTMELSGCDAVFVRADADLELVVKCLVFGLELNAGATCLGPRRVFVPRALAAELETRLVRAFSLECRAQPIRGAIAPATQRLLEDAVARGARVLTGAFHTDRVDFPIVLGSVAPDVPMLREDVFAPVLSLISVESDDEALLFNGACPYALGATVFGRDTTACHQLAHRIRAGGVGINDLIAPTADPRLPFGGRGRSGFGVTRGAEGLLELTVPKVITWNAARWRPHLDEALMGDAPLFQAFVQLCYGRWRDRGAALRRLCGLVIKWVRSRRE